MLTLRQLAASGRCAVEVRRWDSDRFFYIVLSGRYDVFIDARLIRTMGPGDHFGELAARDWGGGYGYARLATVRCAEAGRLLRLTSEDFQWLIDTEPAIEARLAATLAERLRQRLSADPLTSSVPPTACPGPRRRTR